MVTPPVRHLDEALARLRIRAAEHGCSAEAEHREILHFALATDKNGQSGREEIARPLAEFRQRTAGRGSAAASELLHESRVARLRARSRLPPRQDRAAFV
jgi:antitoxin FitA